MTRQDEPHPGLRGHRQSVSEQGGPVSAMLGKTVPGHAGPCIRAGRGCTCYFYLGKNGTRTRPSEQRRMRRTDRRREQRCWRSVFVARERT